MNKKVKNHIQDRIEFLENKIMLHDSGKVPLVNSAHNKICGAYLELCELEKVIGRSKWITILRESI